MFLLRALPVAVKDSRKDSILWPCIVEYFSLQSASAGKVSRGESFISWKLQRLKTGQNKWGEVSNKNRVSEI